jgi:hypothetical protein
VCKRIPTSPDTPTPSTAIRIAAGTFQPRRPDCAAEEEITGVGRSLGASRTFASSAAEVFSGKGRLHFLQNVSVPLVGIPQKRQLAIQPLNLLTART